MNITPLGRPINWQELNQIPSNGLDVWRCEHCRKLQPARIPSVVIFVDEIGDRWQGTTVKRKARFVRRMVVCPPCRRSITDQEGESPTPLRPVSQPADSEDTTTTGDTTR